VRDRKEWVVNTILVALDVNPESSTLTEQVLQTLQQIQLSPKANAVLVHVVPTNQTELEVVVDRPGADLENFPFNRIEKQLQEYQKVLPCSSELEIVTGDPAEEIIRLANIYRADLILIGSRGLTGVQRIVKGSVSSQIVEDAHCSVMVVKPK
jgi:nucleotide-binding universal stress UspA family protein